MKATKIIVLSIGILATIKGAFFLYEGISSEDEQHKNKLLGLAGVAIGATSFIVFTKIK